MENQSTQYKIRIKLSGDKNMELTVSNSDSVEELKRKIKTELHMETENLKLIFKGKILKDSETLEQLKATEGSVIHLVRPFLIDWG